MGLALFSLSESHVIHRNISLKNIYNNKDIYTLGGFSSSRVYNSADMQQQVLTAQVGVNLNRAPETFTDSTNYTEKIDVWALGCVLHEMLFGKHFMDGVDIANFAQQLINRNYQVPTSGVFISDAAKRLLQACLAKNPQDRISIID